MKAFQMMSQEGIPGASVVIIHDPGKDTFYSFGHLKCVEEMHSFTAAGEAARVMSRQGRMAFTLSGDGLIDDMFVDGKKVVLKDVVNALRRAK